MPRVMSTMRVLADQIEDALDAHQMKPITREAGVRDADLVAACNDVIALRADDDAPPPCRGLGHLRATCARATEPPIR